MSQENKTIAVVGGGIAGLFCAYVLIKKGYNVDLYEAASRVGGRIRTIRLDMESKELPLKVQENAEMSREKNGGNKNGDENQDANRELEFYAEFGPMRIELDKQLLLSMLLKHLDITEDRDTGEPYIVDFPEYASRDSSRDPQYKLRAEETSKTSLQLLRLALMRIICCLSLHKDIEKKVQEEEQKRQCHDDKQGNPIEEAATVVGTLYGEMRDLIAFRKKQHTLKNDIILAKALDQDTEAIFNKWMQKLTEADYWVIQKYGEIGEVKLYNMGFWNLLSDHLSYDAVSKIRNQGTFYHLLPENPNAAEWLVWWLRGLSITANLKGIYGGMEYIIDRLEKKIYQESAERHKYTPQKDTTVTGLNFNNGNVTLDTVKTSSGDAPKMGEKRPSYKHVILALPRQPLEVVWNNSRSSLKSLPELKEVAGLLEANFGFHMIKAFFVVKNRWWEEETRANWYATRVPTRELHYWKGRSKGSKQGMIMMYTDRPASVFWSNYVNPGDQFDVYRRNAENSADQLHDIQDKRLNKKAVQLTHENDLPGSKVEDIVWCGIRDWGRKPYGGANHAWIPERKFWVAMAKLGNISLKGSDGNEAYLHVCGEAYSDYHGFIEGSLRSAIYALHKVLDRDEVNNNAMPLSWLSDGKIFNIEETPEDEIAKQDQARREEYFRSLVSWVRRLDESVEESLTDF